MAVKSPGTGVTLWTDVADDRGCATILAAAGEQLVVPENYESAPPRTFAESASSSTAATGNKSTTYSHAQSSASTGCTRNDQKLPMNIRYVSSEQVSCCGWGGRAAQDGCTSARPREKGRSHNKNNFAAFLPEAPAPALAFHGAARATPLGGPTMAPAPLSSAAFRAATRSSCLRSDRRRFTDLERVAPSAARSASACLSIAAASQASRNQQ